MKFRYSIARNALPLLTAAIALMACQACWGRDESPKVIKKESHQAQDAAKTEVIEIPGREGKLGYRGTVLDGKLEGWSEQWWDDGTRMSKKKFHRGVLVDSSYFWNMEGQISEISVFENGNPISTESWNSKGVKKYRSVRIRDSTYHTIRWNESGEKIKDTLETHPKVRWTKDPPSSDRRRLDKGYE